MDKTLRKYRSKGEAWQLGWYRSPYWVAEEEGGRPFQPCVLVCLSLRTGRSQSSVPGPGEPGPEAFRELVMQTARAWRLRPERIEVTDARVAEELRGVLSAGKVAVELRSDLPELRALQEERVRSLRSVLPPAALDAPGVTVERMAAFAGAAARFAAAAPWRHLHPDDILLLEADGLPLELSEAQVFGPPLVPGIQFLRQEAGEVPTDLFPEEEEPDWDDEDWEEDDWFYEDGLWRVIFVPPSDLPPEDVEIWLEHGLPLARSWDYPLAVRRFDERAERPDARFLRWFEAVLDALASTTEEEMDTGRWEKEVITSGGPVRLVLTLPDVLLPPYADSLPPEGGDEVPEEMRLAFELAIEAFGSFGRRQIHLARRAVALWPDCFEAWHILARRALDRETARDLYAEAVAAGERLLPGIELREKPLDEEELRSVLPYFWARSGLASTLWELGAREEALGHFRWLLGMAPDNRESAWLLAHALLVLGRDEEAEELLKHYADGGFDWLYVQALLTFRREGDSLSARQQMAVALVGDRYLAKQLSGRLRPEEIEDESAAFFQEAWESTPGALEALRAQSAALANGRKGEKKKRKRR